MKNAFRNKIWACALRVKSLRKVFTFYVVIKNLVTFYTVLAEYRKVRRIFIYFISLSEHTVDAWLVLDPFFIHVLGLCIKYMHAKKAWSTTSSVYGIRENKNGPKWNNYFKVTKRFAKIIKEIIKYNLVNQNHEVRSFVLFYFTINFG